jgi:hypothetical protein
MGKSKQHVRDVKSSKGNVSSPSIDKDSKKHHEGHRVIRYEEQSQGPITIVRRKRFAVDRPSSPTQSNQTLTLSRFVEGELRTTSISSDLGEYEAGILSEGELNSTNCDPDQPSTYSLAKFKVNKSFVESKSDEIFSRELSLSPKLQKMSVHHESTSYDSKTIVSSNETLINSDKEGGEESSQIFNKMHGDSEESPKYTVHGEAFQAIRETKKEPDPDETDEDEYLETQFEEEGLAAGGSAKVEGSESMYTVDFEAFLWTFEPVIRSASIKLKSQIIPFDKPFTLHLSDVYSPIRFWFHCEEEAIKMMELLQLDYEKLRPTDLKIYDENIKSGMLVACFYHVTRQWHRAQIIIKPSDNNKDKNCARVFFVDFGTVSDSETSDLKVSCR